MITRHVIRGWLFKRVVLEVADTGMQECHYGVWQLHQGWRKATPRDLVTLEHQEKAEYKRQSSDLVLPVGTRVRVRAGFNVGAKGSVTFQEPCGGKVWVLRDGASSPVYYWVDELVIEQGSEVHEAA